MDNLMALATGLISHETRRVETAAQNIANVATPAYKRQIAFDDVLANGTAAGATPPVNALPPAGTATDFAAGKLIHTGNPLDLSISGTGFFEVATADGLAYTRAGSFQRDADGRLVTAKGAALQALGGADVVVRSNNWRIERDGTLVDDGIPSTSIRVVTFPDAPRLTRSEDGLFRADGGTQAVEVESPQLVQGFVESSNVSVGNDMMQMMDAMRRVESGQKIVHAYDDMIGTVLQRLGDLQA